MLVVRTLLPLALVIACAGPAPATPTALAPTATPSPTPAPTPSPTRAALLDFPPGDGVALQPGRYSSQPPFDIAFSFEIPVAGWGSAHQDGEFFDVIQPAQVGVSPTRWIAWALPTILHGAQDVEAAELAPDDAVAALASHPDIESSEPVPYAVDGVGGLMLDLATEVFGVELFGGPAGDLQLDPDYQTRLIILPHDQRLLLVLVLAPRGELEQAWADSKPIVDSIEL